MKFEWDEEKRQRLLRERGVDFGDAFRLFDGRAAVTERSVRGPEARWRTTAIIDGRAMTVVWTMRGESIRIVTMRRAHAKEERQHRQLHR